MNGAAVRTSNINTCCTYMRVYRKRELKEQVHYKYFSLSVGPVVNVMYFVFLGVTSKTSMGFWLDAAHCFKPFCIRWKVYIYINTYVLYTVYLLAM